MSTTDIIEKTEGADEVTKTRKRTVKPIKKFPSHSIEEALKIPTLIKENNGGNHGQRSNSQELEYEKRW